jgi:hypothetical protein
MNSNAPKESTDAWNTLEERRFSAALRTHTDKGFSP